MEEAEIRELIEELREARDDADQKELRDLLNRAANQLEADLNA